jgi:ElaB/YqjD/DUF883 family membrane-anchored ribosome-binding protein
MRACRNDAHPKQSRTMSKSQTEARSESRAGGNADGGIGARSHEAAEQLKSVAHERAERVRHAAESVKEHTAKRVRKLGVAVRAIGENMRIDDEPWMARYADTASKRLDDVAKYLTDHDSHDVIHDAEQFMRRRPSLFFGSALLVGLAAGRFLKSSRPHLRARTS